MNVWIDLSNSPHALLFAPIAARLEELGHTVRMTARDNAQTVELARERWPDVTVVGGESPGERAAKAQALLRRIRSLRRFARSEGVELALSHNSYAQIAAARAAGVRAVTAMDFEHQPANQLAFRLAQRVLLPEALRGSGVASQGASPRKTRFYAGFKEELYLADFVPDERVLESLGVGRDGRLLVVARTPPARAIYHRFGNALFEELLRRLGAEPDVVCVVLPRHREQAEAIRELGLPLVVPERAVDSRSLVRQADLVLGAGGTMTREAALLGVPAVSVFAGETPAVDRELIRRGLLRRIERADELFPLRPRERDPRPLAELAARQAELVEWFVAAAGAA